MIYSEKQYKELVEKFEKAKRIRREIRNCEN